MGRWAIINTFLGLIVLLLAVEIARTWARSLPPVEIAARPAARQATPEKREKAERGKHAGVEKAGARAEQAPAAMVAAIVDKDLFDPSRQRPAEDVKVDAPKQTEPPKGITVVGVSIVGKEREAFITDSGQPSQPNQPGQPVLPVQAGQQRRVRVGDQIQDYTVKAIDKNGLTLVSPSGDVVDMTLELVKSGAVAGPRPGQPPKPGAGPASPAAGSQAASPAAGVAAPKPAPVPARATPGLPMPGVPPRAAAAPGPAGQPGMPNDVRARLQQLGERKGAARSGRKR